MAENGVLYATGVIHGRFQVLHNDHVKYIMAGKRLCHNLVIGITNPDIITTGFEKSDPKRDEVLANPLTYYERYIIIKNMMLENSVDFKQISIVPFPINYPDMYKQYLPMDGVFFLTIYDDWGRQKLKYFKSLNLKYHVLWEISYEEKGISSTDIRSDMLNNKKWQDRVPESTQQLLVEWNIVQRLKKMSNIS